MDRSHNPEFTTIEFYHAYATYEDLMTLTEQLFEKLALDVCGTTEIEYQGQQISLKAPFRRATRSSSASKRRSSSRLSSRSIRSRRRRWHAATTRIRASPTASSCSLAAA